MPSISLKIRLQATNINLVGLTKTQVAKINRKVANQFIDIAERHITPAIANDNKIGVTGFRKIRIKKKRALSRKGKGIASLWVGENDVLAQFKKGTWKRTKEGAGKGNFFKKGAFVLPLSTGKKLLVTREHGKLEAVRVPLHNYRTRVNQGVSKAQKGVLASFNREVKIELGKKK